MKKKEKNVKFTNKGNSRRGILSLVLSAFSLVWLIYCIGRAFVLGSGAGNELGGVGVLALLLGAAGGGRLSGYPKGGGGVCAAFVPLVGGSLRAGDLLHAVLKLGRILENGLS